MRKLENVTDLKAFKNASGFVCIGCEDPEEYRQERYNLIGEPTEEMIAEWKAKYGDFNKKVQKALKGE